MLIGENLAVDLSNGQTGIAAKPTSARYNLGNLGVPPTVIRNSANYMPNKSKNFTYKSGTAYNPQRSLSNNKPSYLNNRCLVIKGIGKHLNKYQLKQKINDIAGKRINYLFDPIMVNLLAPLLLIIF